jgi:hypothetical protein
MTVLAYFAPICLGASIGLAQLKKLADNTAARCEYMARLVTQALSQ